MAVTQEPGYIANMISSKSRQAVARAVWCSCKVIVPRRSCSPCGILVPFSRRTGFRRVTLPAIMRLIPEASRIYAVFFNDFLFILFRRYAFLNVSTPKGQDTESLALSVGRRRSGVVAGWGMSTIRTEYRIRNLLTETPKPSSLSVWRCLWCRSGSSSSARKACWGSWCWSCGPPSTPLESTSAGSGKSVGNSPPDMVLLCRSCHLFPSALFILLSSGHVKGFGN